MRLREQVSHTSDPQLRQLCLSRASCASLSDVLAQVNLLAQQELEQLYQKMDLVMDLCEYYHNINISYDLPCIIFIECSPLWRVFWSLSNVSNFR